MSAARAGTFGKKSSRLLLALALTLALACGGSGASGGREISPRELLAVAGQAGAPLVLDVRSPEEFVTGHVPGARNVEYDEVAARLAELGPAREVVVYCEKGGRAAKAEQVLREAGFEVRHLSGDMRGWRAEGLPVER
jgi:rhodanese-related sulfurtransferase